MVPGHNTTMRPKAAQYSPLRPQTPGQAGKPVHHRLAVAVHPARRPRAKRRPRFPSRQHLRPIRCADPTWVSQSGAVAHPLSSDTADARECPTVSRATRCRNCTSAGGRPFGTPGERSRGRTYAVGSSSFAFPIATTKSVGVDPDGQQSKHACFARTSCAGRNPCVPPQWQYDDYRSLN